VRLIHGVNRPVEFLTTSGRINEATKLLEFADYFHDNQYIRLTALVAS